MSLQSAPLVGSYNVEMAPYGLCLTTGHRGCLAITGFIFFLPGFFMVAALLHFLSAVRVPEDYSGEWYGLFGLGLAFIAFGLSMAFYKSIIAIDTRKREIRMMRGMFRLRTVDRYKLDDCIEMVLTRDTLHDSDSHDQVAFSLTLLASNGHNVVLGRYFVLADALRVGQDICRRIGLKFYDHTVVPKREVGSEGYTADRCATGMNMQDIARFDTAGVDFKWDGDRQSLSQLLTAEHKGCLYYKVLYPKYVVPRFLALLFSIGFFVNFFGWRVDKVFTGLLEGFMDPRFLISAEVFFTNIMVGMWTFFLILFPALVLLRIIFTPASFNMIGLTPNGLYLEDTKGPRMRRRSRWNRYSPVLIRYSDIRGVDIKSRNGIGHRQRKWEQSENCLALRAGTEMYEIGNGLNVIQLQHIAEEIRGRLV